MLETMSGRWIDALHHARIPALPRDELLPESLSEGIEGSEAGDLVEGST